MRELARFEGYIDEFRVSDDDLLVRGLPNGAAPGNTLRIAPW